MSTPAYNPTAAALLARCSALAYVRSAPAFGRDAAVLGLTEMHRFEEPHTDTQGFIARAGGAIIVCFRGSESAQDWITDLKARQIITGGRRKAHAGFVNAHLSAWPMVCRELVDRIRATPDAQLWFTGHSLGGALALLAAKDAADGLPGIAARRVKVITFGAPRVGNRAWARAYDRLLRDQTFRVVNEEDPVPRVPLALRGYQHVGHELFFTHLSQRITDPPLWARLVSDLFGLWHDWRRGRFAVITDHCVSHYVRLTGRDRA